MKNRVIVRNFMIFTIIIGLCIGALAYFTIYSTRDIKITDSWIGHTQKVIVQTQHLLSDMLTMLSSQRGYLLSKDADFLISYEDAKGEVVKQIAGLKVLVTDNTAQAVRLAELQGYSLEYAAALDLSLQNAQSMPGVGTMGDKGQIMDLRENITRVANAMLEEEYARLNDRAQRLDVITERYQVSLFVGGLVAALIVLIFNWYLLVAQDKILSAEEAIKQSEERFRLAIKGSNDGIFDWDFKTHYVYWSEQYKAILGYEDNEIDGGEEMFRRLIHPEDSDIFWSTFNKYINGEVPEFSAIYRMVHKDGRAVWIHGRGKAIFGEDGLATRFIGAHTDISYIKDHERQLKEERDRAEAANSAKSDFLAHMSHEIRTPLTAISGIAEIFSQGQEFVGTRNEKLVKTLRTSTESLKELITDILDFSKIESGELEMEMRHFNLGELFQQVISIMILKAQEKKLEFGFNYESLRDTNFYGDKTRIRQILINLIGNAIKFTEHGFVRVRAVMETVGDDSILRIEIEDSGIGINEKSLGVIFEKFKQADSSVSRKYGGTGLGLPISKNLADLMGGTIHVQSEMGHGSTFSLILPFRSEHSEENAGADDLVRAQKINERLRAVIGKKSNVMLVEDYEGSIVVLSYILSSLDCSYEVAKTGLEAVQLFKKGHFDLILMDIQMPEMDGLTATRTIRKMENERELPQTPIIGLTAHALIADKQKCIDAGMNDYLSKPIVEAELKEAILNLMESRAA